MATLWDRRGLMLSASDVRQRMTNRYSGGDGVVCRVPDRRRGTEAEVSGRVSMASGRCTVATRVADRCNADKHAVQKESEPRAFAVSHRPDSIDAAVPIARIVAFAQQEHHAPALSRLQHDSHLKRRARIETAAPRRELASRRRDRHTSRALKALCRESASIPGAQLTALFEHAL